GAPWLLATHIASGMDAVVQVLGHGLLAVLALAGTRAVAGAGPLRRPALLALLALALGWTGLLLLRATTPFYMVLMLGPALALLLALALEGLARAGRPRATAGAAVAMVLLALLANARLLQRALHGAMDFSPAAVLDVRHWHLPGGLVALFQAWQQDRLGALQCASAAMHRIDILHGELAVLGDAALVLPARLRCGTPRHLGVGGGADVPGARHRLGLTPAMLRQLGHGGVDWSQALQLAPTAVIGAGAPLAVPDGSIYPPRPLGLGQAREHVFQVQLPGGAVVLVGQLFALYGGSTEGVNANGLPMAPVARSSIVAALRC